MPNVLSHVTFPDLTEIVGTHYSSILDSLDGWLQSIVGAGTITYNPDYTQIYGGPTPGDLATLSKLLSYPPQDFSFGNKTILRTRVGVFMEANDDDQTLLGVGDILLGSSAFGVRFKSTKVQGFSANASGSSSVDLITGLTPPWDATYLINIILFPGVRIEYWFNGVFLAAKTNDLPGILDLTNTMFAIQAGFADIYGANLSFSAFDFYTIP